MDATMSEFFGYALAAPSTAPSQQAGSGYATPANAAPKSSGATAGTVNIGAAIPGWFVGIALALVAVRVLWEMGAEVD